MFVDQCRQNPYKEEKTLGETVGGRGFQDIIAFLVWRNDFGNAENRVSAGREWNMQTDRSTENCPIGGIRKNKNTEMTMTTCGHWHRRSPKNINLVWQEQKVAVLEMRWITWSVIIGIFFRGFQQQVTGGQKILDLENV